VQKKVEKQTSKWFLHDALGMPRPVAFAPRTVDIPALGNTTSIFISYQLTIPFNLPPAHLEEAVRLH